MTKKRRRPRVVLVLAGALTLACVCLVGTGVLLTESGPVPTPGPATPTPYAARLSCSDCQAAGMSINLWQNGQADRGRVVGHGWHGDPVQVLGRQHEPSENRDYLRVRVIETGSSGWVPEPFVLVP